jgi:hypothetical protein
MAAEKPCRAKLYRAHDAPLAVARLALRSLFGTLLADCQV